MKHFFSALLLVVFFVPVFGQVSGDWNEGAVSFLSSRNVYVKFGSTKGISVGDTLFVMQNNVLTPALLVSNKSSTSVVCTYLKEVQLEVRQAIYSRKPVLVEPEPEELSEPFPAGEPSTTSPQVKPSFQEEDQAVSPQFKQKIKGRISAGSYSTTSDYGDNHRMRYAFNFRGQNLNDSRFSVDNYITFRHTLGEWAEVQDNVFNALKVYSLAGKYDFDHSSLIMGRSINYKISSMGAIDGLQYEHNFGQLVLGAIVGSRPDYSDYSFNFNLLQAGAFVSLQAKENRGYSTLAFVEQHNGSAIDRRFVYFQHSSSPIENLNIFGSFEVDAYQKINEEVSNKPRLTNLYFSARYRFSRKFSIRASYDNRNNIIYYESYKNFIDQLIENETRQGLRLGVSIRPVRLISLGLNGSWRFQKSDMNLSKNLNGYVNFNRVPVLNARLTLRANLLETNYLQSQRFGARLSRDIIRGKLSAEVHYDYVKYRYSIGDYSFSQNIAGASLNLRLLKKLSLYFYYEGTFDDQNRQLNRFNSKIIQRF